MEKTRYHLNTGKCTCNHKAPPLRVIRSVAFNKAKAGKLCEFQLSGDGTADLIVTELLDCHSGLLFDWDGKPIVLDTDDPSEVARFDALFSEDQRRFINRYKERALDGEFRYRLQERLVYSVMMIHFAMAIRECRLYGDCAAR